ncbi:MAG: hypothetical protein WA126_01585 [Thermodesulfovibrionales bacterium]
MRINERTLCQTHNRKPDPPEFSVLSERRRFLASLEMTESEGFEMTKDKPWDKGDFIKNSGLYGLGLKVLIPDKPG